MPSVRRRNPEHSAGTDGLDLGNVAVFDTESRIPGEKFSYALNQRLPEDIRIQLSEELAEMQQACGVDTLRLADYGVREEDCGKIAENAVVTMGGLFRADPRRLESSEIEDIIRESI